MIDGRTQSIQCEDFTLEGLLHLPEGAGPFPGAVICHPHPQMGGDMYNNVVGALVRAALDSGFAALRFNFRGTGESGGAYSGGEGEQEDIRSALAHLAGQPELDDSRIVLAGYSFGAMVALRVASGRDDLTGVVTVGTPTQGNLVSGLRLDVPALFVTGDRDDYCDGQLLERQRQAMGPDITVEILPGVDHFWVGSDQRLIDIVSPFLQRL